MTNKNIWAIMLIAGIVIAGVSLALSEASFLDDRVKYPEDTFKTIQRWANAGLGLGGLLSFTGLLIGFAGVKKGA